MLANELINACEEEGAKNVRNDTLQERKPCVKARKSEKSKIGQTFVVVVVVVAIFFLDSKREKKKIESIVSLNDLIVGGRISEFFSFSKLD
jgi:hypothetical protein